MVKVVRVRVPERMKERFLIALKGNKDEQENIMREWISDYVEKYEEDSAAKKLNEEANHLKTKKSNYPRNCGLVDFY